MSSEKIRTREVKNQGRVHYYAKNSAYVGSTIDIDDTLRRHTDNGFRGKMYYAKTSNMKYSENRLLSKGYGRHNKQRKSNAKASDGWVYTIVGQKRRVG